MLRTEHISRSTKKENFLALIGYEVKDRYETELIVRIFPFDLAT